jgi:hypothetical protein
MGLLARSAESERELLIEADMVVPLSCRTRRPAGNDTDLPVPKALVEFLGSTSPTRGQYEQGAAKLASRVMKCREE